MKLALKTFIVTDSIYHFVSLFPENSSVILEFTVTTKR